jgi:hypothetical protein
MRIVERFAEEHRLEAAEVEVELFDGSRYRLSSASAEPGFGFMSLVPVPETDEPPRILVVPVGAVRAFEISVPDPERPFGFTASEPA